MNRKCLIACWVMLFPASVFSVCFSMPELTAEHHMPLSTDTLAAYRLPYVAVNDSGTECIWDFSSIPVDDATTVSLDYFSPPSGSASLGLHREYSNYYYSMAADTLFLLSYENSRSRVHYTPAIPLLTFPFSMGDSLFGLISGRGQYCHILSFNVEGAFHVCADAVGQLRLPDIVVDSALRVHTYLQYCERNAPHTAFYSDIYRWYSPLCRYPLFETILDYTIKRGDTLTVASSYYFPQSVEQVVSRVQYLQDSVDSFFADTLLTDVTFAPNPVYAALQVNYTLIRSAEVYVSIHYNGGATTYQTPPRSEQEGDHSVAIDMAGLPVGTYVVYVHADDTVVSGNIIKL